MERCINNKNFLAIILALSALAAAGSISARPIDEPNALAGCANAQQIVDEFRAASSDWDTEETFSLESPIGGRPFQVRWLDFYLPVEVNEIDPEQDDPETVTKGIGRQGALDPLRVTVAFARKHVENIDPEQDDPETKPEHSLAGGQSSSSVEMVFFEESGSSTSGRGLEGCVRWTIPSTETIDPEQDDPETTPHSVASSNKTWARFSLPPQFASIGLEDGRQNREDLFWWLLGLVEITSARR